MTFVSRWYGTKALSCGDALAAAKSRLWLLIADQSLITLINGRGFWGAGLWGLLSVSVKLKRSHRRPEQHVGPVGAISGLTADTSEMDRVASVQEKDLLLTDQKKSSLRRGGGRGKKPFLLFLLNYSSVIHNDKVDLAPFSTDRGGFCSVSSHCEIIPMLPFASCSEMVKRHRPSGMKIGLIQQNPTKKKEKNPTLLSFFFFPPQPLHLHPSPSPVRHLVRIRRRLVSFRAHTFLLMIYCAGEEFHLLPLPLAEPVASQ